MESFHTLVLKIRVQMKEEHFRPTKIATGLKLSYFVSTWKQDKYLLIFGNKAP